jgi:D-glycero-D-manno-heptose 1,7-bisphosphate phosphatase
MNKAVFLDKDGTIIPDVPYNVDPARIHLENGVAEGMRLLKQAGYLLMVVSNQSGVAHGYFTEEDLILVERKLQQELKAAQASLDGFFYCPHHPDGTVAQYSFSCDCRKPKAGMLFKAAQKFNIDLSRSWMIGDILNDVEAGNQAGCSTILIDNGNETEWAVTEARTPTAIVDNITAAVSFILSEKEHEEYNRNIQRV